MEICSRMTRKIPIKAAFSPEKYSDLANHYAIQHPLFKLLKEQFSSFPSSLQFQAVRDNYLYRTLNTIPCVAYTLIAAAKNFDHQAIALLGKNLSEETGEGKAEDSHIFLLLLSFNEHGERTFGIPPIHPEELVSSPLITEEVKYFAIKQRELYQSNSYPIVLGASMAQELAAEPMLKSLYRAIFLPYRSFYSFYDYKKISKYFLCHLDGTEKQHALDTYQIASHLSKDPENAALILEGATRFLELQAMLWDGLYELLKKLAPQSVT